MSPFDANFYQAPVMSGAGKLNAPVLAPVIEDFDPFQESLAFTLAAEDEDGVIVLRDLIDGSAVQVEVNGRLVVTLMGCVADDLPAGCLSFEFED